MAMISVVCPNCSAKYRFDEARLQGKASVRAKCQKCGESIEITPSGAESEAPPGAPKGRTTTRARRMRSDEDRTVIPSAAPSEELQLPSDKKFSVAVLQGAAGGEIFPITKARVTMGRADCDIVLDDPECSREHAVIEILGSRVVIRDLNSTNGTFVDRKRIEEAELDNQSEFRVGEHVLMLIITSQE